MNTHAEPAPDGPRLDLRLFDRSPLALVRLKGAGHVVADLTPAFARLVGGDGSALVGRPFAEAVPGGHADGCAALLDRVFRTGVAETLAEQERRGPPPACWSYQAWATPAGVMLQVTDSTEAARFRLDAVAMNEALLVSSVRQHELIETIRQGEQARQALEAQVLQAQKLDSLGVLAGGVAHDLNNILTPVIGFAEMAKDALPAGSPAGPLLDQVLVNSRRAADLVQQILAYAGKGQFSVCSIDLSALVRDMDGLLASAVSNRAELRYELTPDLPPVEADAAQLGQVILNLVTNAAEAIGPDGGTVALGTRLTRVGHESLWSAYLKAHLPAGLYLALEVADTGCGMAGDVAARIFDPFFTTKFVGRGLGLAAVQGIAHRHGGVVQVESEPGRGSTFRLLLPASAGAALPPPPPGTPDGWRGAGTVLVIDDDEGVRNTAARTLERAGFAVLAARGGRHGLEVFHGRPAGIDAAVVDLTMPGMGGLETVAALRRVRPDLPAVLMSGFSAHESGHLSAAHRIEVFVQKPFAAAELVAAVRHALERRLEAAPAPHPRPG